MPSDENCKRKMNFSRRGYYTIMGENLKIYAFLSKKSIEIHAALWYNEFNKYNSN